MQCWLNLSGFVGLNLASFVFSDFNIVFMLVVLLTVFLAVV